MLMVANCLGCSTTVDSSNITNAGLHLSATVTIDAQGKAQISATLSTTAEDGLHQVRLTNGEYLALQTQASATPLLLSENRHSNELGGESVSYEAQIEDAPTGQFYQFHLIRKVDSSLKQSQVWVPESARFSTSKTVYEPDNENILLQWNVSQQFESHFAQYISGSCIMDWRQLPAEDDGETSIAAQTLVAHSKPSACTASIVLERQATGQVDPGFGGQGLLSARVLAEQQVELQF